MTRLSPLEVLILTALIILPLATAAVLVRDVFPRAF
jgi:hypothetical protein